MFLTRSNTYVQTSGGAGAYASAQARLRTWSTRSRRADRRDPCYARAWITLVDGNNNPVNWPHHRPPPQHRRDNRGRLRPPC